MAEDYTFRTTEANGITYFDVVLATGDDAVSIEAELDVETGGAWWWFIADYADGSSGSFLCNDMRIFGRGGNDIITVSHVPWGTVFGGWGRDTINVSNATQVVCLPLSSAEQLEAAQNPALLDEEDTFNFDNAKSCAALGGDGADVYNLSGDCNTTTLDGGNGGDVVNAGRLTNFRDGYVTLGNGLNKISGATGDWSNTFIRGGRST